MIGLLRRTPPARDLFHGFSMWLLDQHKAATAKADGLVANTWEEGFERGRAVGFVQAFDQLNPVALSPDRP